MFSFERIRAAAAEVARRARFVGIEPDALARLAFALAPALDAATDAGGASAPGPLDPAHHFVGPASETLAFVVTLDAVNFGSGWFPYLEKRPGLSGYFTVATSLKEHFEARGPLSAEALRSQEPRDCARLFGQVAVMERPEVTELMTHFAAALRQLGEWLEASYAGRFEGLPAEASGSAARLLSALARMESYRDVSEYDGLEVPFFKRAQLTASDLAAAFGGEGYGRFDDLDELTLFADNLVPHVLRREGALLYDAALAARIDAGELIQPGSPEEVEIRAVAVHAVEQMVAVLREAGRVEATAHRLDGVLWNRGQRPEIKAHPRHRARCTFY